MSSWFTKEQIIDLKSKIDYREYYSQYLTLKDCGANWFASCPFHNGDNTPSLSISKEAGIYHCFACGSSGDIITFEMNVTGKNFNEAVMNIAKSQDIALEISEELKKEIRLKNALYLLNNNIASLYQKALAKNKEGQDYIISRGFNLDIIKQFKLGYIPTIQLKDLNPKLLSLLKENNLVRINDEGEIFNYFGSHRISIPFFDEYGHIIGFSARATDDKYKPKYLHSKTSRIFHKDEVLFGYNFAKNTIKKTKSIIIVEGNIDCIKAHQYQITNCIATCGLALSEKQLKLLSTDVKNYYLVVEDKAGEAALDRFYDTIIQINYWANVKIIRLYDKPDEKCDLDEFLTKYGKGAFLERVKHAKTYHEYKLIDSLRNINYSTIEEKKFHIYNNRKYIAKITNPIDKKQYIELLAEKLELPENDVRKIIAKSESTNSIKVGDYDDRRVTSQKYILATFFSNFDTFKVYSLLQEDLKVYTKMDKKFVKIYEKIISVILMYGSNCDIINHLHSLDIMSQEELQIIDDSYFKREDFDYLSDGEEEQNLEALKEFIIDQLDNLK